VRFFRTRNVHIYAPQTKIGEGETKDEMRIFELTVQWFVAQIEYSPAVGN